MQRHVHEAAVAVGAHPRHPGDRGRLEASVAHDAEPPGPLRDEHASVWQEGQAPRVRQAPDDHAYADALLLLGRHELERPGPQRWHRQADAGRHLRVADDEHADNHRHGHGEPACVGTSHHLHLLGHLQRPTSPRMTHVGLALGRHLGAV